jgi:hypothetical protein
MSANVAVALGVVGGCPSARREVSSEVSKSGASLAK